MARDYKDNIDAAIRLTRDHPDFRWTIESAWMLEEWLRRTEDESLVTELGNMLRQGRIPGSERWVIAEMTPNTHPLEELEVALLRAASKPRLDRIHNQFVRPAALGNHNLLSLAFSNSLRLIPIR